MQFSKKKALTLQRNWYIYRLAGWLAGLENLNRLGILSQSEENLCNTARHHLSECLSLARDINQDYIAENGEDK